ncbi:MAG: folate-binding protein [Alphaproteobacteria bacterium]
MPNSNFERSYTPLPRRKILSIAGSDARQFLQDLISNDMRKVSPTQVIWAALLTPQGKFLHEFFVSETSSGNVFLLDTEADRLGDLVRRLKLYRLRSKVDITEQPDLIVAAIPGDVSWTGLTRAGSAVPFQSGLIYKDPRLPEAGLRLIAPETEIATLQDQGFIKTNPEHYEKWRLSLGLPDGSQDLVIEKSTLMESGFDELQGIDWAKGCYVGQELTARMKYRGLVKKRLIPVQCSGPTPATGTPILEDGKEVGEMRSGYGNQGLALLKIETLQRPSSPKLLCESVALKPYVPSWMTLPDTAKD